MSATKQRETLARNFRISIQDNVPLPKYTKMARKNDLIDDMQRMKVMQSRLLETNYSKEALNAARTKIFNIVKNPDNKLQGKRFTVNIDEETGYLLRIWRVE